MDISILIHENKIGWINAQWIKCEPNSKLFCWQKCEKMNTIRFVKS